MNPTEVKKIPRWHFAMLNDVARNDAFETAIKRSIKTNCNVLDIGTGSGLLAMLAVRHGAKFVTSCEMIESIANLAEDIIAYNGFENLIKIIPKKSQDLRIGKDLTKLANILITETIDCGLIGEGILPTIRHARESLITPEALIIPSKAKIKFGLLESEQVHNLNFVKHASKFNVSAFNAFSTIGYFPVRLSTWQYSLLSEPTTALEFDFRIDSLKPRQQKISIQVERSGTLHGIVFWFELDLGNNVFFSNTIDNKKSHWMQAVQCFEVPIFVQKNNHIELTIRQDDTNIDFEIT
ncbi:MAG: SAM-dependent methyltransferase [Hapalosiphonaceae cyanobacterium JJU2]|nr:MAG: SAM-dependent methyltransferase [Hapalosiphonaceae cyanobacterium JJU2]